MALCQTPRVDDFLTSIMCRRCLEREGGLERESGPVRVREDCEGLL